MNIGTKYLFYIHAIFSLVSHLAQANVLTIRTATIYLALSLCFTKDLFCDYVSGFLNTFNCLSLSDIVTDELLVT